jgi:myosin heavy subunit
VQLQATLTGRSFQSGNRQTQYHIPLTPVQAKETCAALARAIYHLLFDWLIARINISLKPKQAVRSSACIGVLDIYGFEVFHENSLEQLLINYANERLQQLMSEHWFKFEQLEYEREGIAWSHIDTHERSCIDLLEHRTNGLLSLLDEEGRVPKGSDEVG